MPKNARGTENKTTVCANQRMANTKPPDTAEHKIHKTR